MAHGHKEPIMMSISILDTKNIFQRLQMNTSYEISLLNSGSQQTTNVTALTATKRHSSAKQRCAPYSSVHLEFYDIQLYLKLQLICELNHIQSITLLIQHLAIIIITQVHTSGR